MSRDENFQKLTSEMGIDISLMLISYFLFSLLLKNNINKRHYEDLNETSQSIERSVLTFCIFVLTQSVF